MNQDWLALLISFVYVFAMIGIAEGLRKWQEYSVEFTRKFIHIAVGMWAFGTVLLFERREFAIIPSLAFIVINAISYRQGTFQAMETGEAGKLGTIYFPISFTVIIWLFWDQPHLLVASLMPMTWGDAMAAIIGKRTGKRHYTISGAQRTLEGTLVMFIFSLVATFAALLLLSPATLGLVDVLGVATVTALGATAIEAISPWGIDNLTVPAVSALILTFL
jgi:phytol kinase